MRSKLFLTHFLLYLLAGSVIFLIPVYAQEFPSGTLDEQTRKINEYQEIINKLQGKEKSLKDEISKYDSEIAISNIRIEQQEVEINEKTARIKSISQEIVTITENINKLSDSIIHQIKIIEKRIREWYKRRGYEGKGVSLISLIIGGGTVSESISALKYLTVLENQDREMMLKAKNSREIAQVKKRELEELKIRQELLKLELERAQKTQVAERNRKESQKAEKDYLLKITQSDEKKYQSLLSQARAEREAIERAINSISLKDGSPVKAGDPIAVMGNSGAPACSTGTHLHFEVRKNGSYENPANFLSGRSVIYEERVQPMAYTGSWRWPLNDEIIISQEYGMSFWAKIGFYKGSPHSGIDMYTRGSYTLVAPADGILYKGSIACGGSVLKYVAVDHGGGILSYYLHVQ